MEFKDYYKVLEVARDASPEAIKRSYRKLARRFHPDVSKEPEAEERFKQVQEAYEVLKDPEKRAAYDELGEGYRPGQQFRPPPDWGSRFEFRGGGDPNQGYSDFFSSLFGDSSPFGGAPRGASSTGFRARGEDTHATLDVSLEDAYAGTQKSVELSRQGEPRSRTLRVTIPAGVTEGQLIRLAGQGSPGRGAGSPAGDLYLKVRLLPHAHYRVEGRDVELTLPIAPWEAALGGPVSVPTLGGSVEMRLPAGAKGGSRLRLRGRGLPGDVPGDQYVVLKIVVPATISPRARELYEALRDESGFNPRQLDESNG